MSVLRKITIWFLCLGCVTAVSGIVYILTLESTLLDRTVVKQWLVDARVYDDNMLIDALVQTPPENTRPSDQLTLPPDAIKLAMGNTFTPDFIKTQTENVVNNAYDWMEGKTPTFQFSVPIDQKKEMLIQQLATLIEPQIEAIPACSRAITANCRPSTLNQSQFATEAATQSINESESFDKPITNETFAEPSGKPPKKSESAALAQLPAIRSATNVLFVILPIAAALSLAAIAFLARSSDRLRVFTKLARRLFFSMLLGVIASGVVLWIARDSDFGLKDLLAAQSSAIGGLIAPFLKNMIVGFAGSLLFWSGIFGSISLLVWIGFVAITKRLISTQKILG